MAADSAHAGELHPGFPVVAGELRLTASWRLSLPVPFNRRTESGDLVLWRPGLTFWIAIWTDPDPERKSEQGLEWVLESAAPDRENQRVLTLDRRLLLTYELVSVDPDRTPERYRSVSGYVLDGPEEVQITAYCDDDDALRAAYQVLESVRHA
jgi:hypothetical protein